MEAYENQIMRVGRDFLGYQYFKSTKQITGSMNLSYASSKDTIIYVQMIG